MDAANKLGGAASGLISFIDGANTDSAEIRRLQAAVRQQVDRVAQANAYLAGIMGRFSDTIDRGRELFSQLNKPCRDEDNSVETF